MILYMMRHGESVANQKHCFAGQMQVPLTEKGEAEAERLGTLLRNIPFDKVYSSDLTRAMRTRELALPNTECEITPLLREIDVGLLAGKTFVECREKYEHLYKKAGGNDYAQVEGESREAIRARLNAFLNMVMQTQCETVAAFCHGGIIKTMLRIAAGEGVNAASFQCDNCCICAFEYTGGTWRVKLWNYTG